MNREVKLKELQLLDAARQKFLHFQQKQREAELRRLDDEMQRKVGALASFALCVTALIANFAKISCCI